MLNKGQQQPYMDDSASRLRFEANDDSDDQYRLAAKPKVDVATRLGVALIVVFGISALGIGFWLMQNRLKNPFFIDLAEQTNAGQLSADNQLEQELRNKDTDGDSLNDYEEVYIFKTSPYLTDTDSDGKNDALEISQGTDPNCKEGEDCQGVRILTPEVKFSDLFPQFSPTDATLKDKTISEFRQMLITSGMDPEVVAGFTDDFILFVLEAVVQADTQETNLDDLSDKDIRQFLISVGLQADEVNRVPPEELREMIKILL